MALLLKTPAALPMPVPWFHLTAGDAAPDSRSLNPPPPRSGMGRRDAQKGVSWVETKAV